MSVRRLLTAAAAALLVGFGPATPAAAHVLAQPASAYGWTPERIWGSAAALLALVGVVIGGLALARSAGRIGNGDGGRGAIVALVAGLIAVVNGGLVVVTADGGLGTGNGIAGGYLALALGMIAMVLGGLARARSRRTG
ncbi:hypothetical protein GA0070624_1355 [Micromonospora rhizosphaerae]|uniref:Uncharacterized protein n=1 Tax=Micromonospora rhizosphaerae TaxID=568872 RepID=A0A1C6RKI4_9ACTN|nr:DUF6223 family protein [Micromonospora rhizosphaerae]SCL17682.1 hypothetical protein GA0070624_1355 [Micromonospora rhizosphaerae]